MKWIKNTIWQLCCITFDEDDVSEPPYGETPTVDSDYGKKPEILKRCLFFSRSLHPGIWTAEIHCAK
ncbi:hypothetical protein AVEN_6918-1 [Araneus ventricosus]|uniref:Uncharacterized protein n=1 Tax=Araneus ventricosus TaxID=182803 RepID=A0A4Y2FK72_ARAVE|nr:hypothetical protein AVEN_6918-1 [Araneus ventricosus]